MYSRIKWGQFLRYEGVQDRPAPHTLLDTSQSAVREADPVWSSRCGLEPRWALDGTPGGAQPHHTSTAVSHCVTGHVTRVSEVVASPSSSRRVNLQPPPEQPEAERSLTWAVHGAAVLLSQRACLRSERGRYGACECAAAAAAAAAAPSADTEAAVSSAIDQLQRFIAIVTGLFLVGPQQAHYTPKKEGIKDKRIPKRRSRLRRATTATATAAASAAAAAAAAASPAPTAGCTTCPRRRGRPVSSAFCWRRYSAERSFSLPLPLSCSLSLPPSVFLSPPLFSAAPHFTTTLLLLLLLLLLSLWSWLSPAHSPGGDVSAASIIHIL